MSNDNNARRTASSNTSPSMIGGQLFGLPISRVQDVFMPDRMTRVPLAPPEDRGRAQSARPHRHRDRHAPPARPAAARPTTSRRWRSASSCKGESYGLLIDAVGEVMKLGEATREPNPVNLDARLARVSAGVHRLDGQLMVILDVDRVLESRRRARWRREDDE